MDDVHYTEHAREDISALSSAATFCDHLVKSQLYNIVIWMEQAFMLKAGILWADEKIISLPLLSLS